VEVAGRQAVVVAVLEVAERGVHVQHEVERLRPAELAHVGPDELGVDAGLLGAPSGGLEVPPRRVDAGDLEPPVGEFDGVAADAAGHVQHAPAVDVGQRQQRVQFVGGGVEFLRREQ
jgi:hypothetical protein